ncbi:MAG: hypothetical protein H6560_04040 [Lewinellaceae bacterium]|nr:hypothetical protein [Lewinellaceae bacterium]
MQFKTILPTALIFSLALLFSDGIYAQQGKGKGKEKQEQAMEKKEKAEHTKIPRKTG